MEMNRMNNGMGCCMMPANGCLTAKRTSDSSDGRCQMTRQNPGSAEGRCPMNGRNSKPSENCTHPSHFSDTGQRREEIPFDLPVENRRALLNSIYEEGFASCEAVLYLDTHPNDTDAGKYFRLHNQRYQIAVREYGRLYGPLTIDTASASPTEAWNWMQQPWPWEGGDC